MNLRLRLIVAFFFLSVVPLAAVTLYTYTSNATALRDAAQHEAELLAGELSQRMQVVTAQLSERVGHLMDISTMPPASDAPPATSARKGKAAAAAATNSATDADKVAETLGDVSMLLNNISLTGMRPFGGEGRRGGGGAGGAGANSPTGSGPGGTGGPRGQSGGPDPNAGRSFGRGGFGGPRNGAGPPATAGSPGTVADASSGAARGPAPSSPNSAGAAPSDNGAPRQFPQDRGPRGFGGPRDRGDAAAGSNVVPPSATPPPVSGAGPAPSGALQSTGAPGGPPRVPGTPPPASTADASADKDRIQIDLMPIRRELFQQFASEGQWSQMSDADHQRIIAEVNQRMLGIAQGIQISTTELQKRVTEARQVADSKARDIARTQMGVSDSRATAPATATGPPGPAAAASATTPAAAASATAPLLRKTALSGSHLDVSMMRNGQVIHQANAEVNLPNLLMTVFTTTRRDSGEVPFAVGKDGHIYTPTDDDLKKVQAVGGDPLKPETPPGVMMVRDWIVVTTADPTGSGLKFGIARPVGDSLANLRRTTARNAGFGLMFIALAIAGIVPVASRLTRNLSRLSDGVHRIAQGDYRARVEVRSHDEIGRLAVAFNQMAEDVERHQRAVVEQERTKRELELGRQIQHDMLPQSPLRFGPIEIEGVSVPAREVGGDFFNYFELPSGQVALLVGDVSGKGVGAALLMANIQASLRTRLALGQDLASLAHEIDRDVEASTPGSVYATLFVGVLDPATRELRYVNAGHYPQYVVRRSGLERMAATGLPVGLLAGRGYSESKVQLVAGDLLFFYTDGCVDNESESGEMFNVERLEEILTRCAAEGSRDVLARVEKTVSDFRGQREPFDDATTMVVKVG